MQPCMARFSFVLALLGTSWAQDAPTMTSAAVAADGTVSEEPLIADLHKGNFDAALREHDEVLVHFYAPWSKRCEIMRPHLESAARSDSWGSRFMHARSDISDPRGYTSYIEMYGVIKLPTIILFRNGHANMFPLDSALTLEALDAWLRQIAAQEMQARDEKDAHAERVVEAAEMMRNKHKREAELARDAARARGEDPDAEPSGAPSFGTPAGAGPGKPNVKDSALRLAQRQAAESTASTASTAATAARRAPRSALR